MSPCGQLLGPVAAAVWEGKDPPFVVLGDAVGLLHGSPVGAVSEVLGNLVGSGDGVVVGVHQRPKSLQPITFLAKKRMHPLLIHLYLHHQHAAPPHATRRADP